MCRMCTNISVTRGDRGHESNITAYDAPVTDAASKCDTGVLGAPQKQVSYSVSIRLRSVPFHCLCRLSCHLLSRLFRCWETDSALVAGENSCLDPSVCRSLL